MTVIKCILFRGFGLLEGVEEKVCHVSLRMKILLCNISHQRGFREFETNIHIVGSDCSKLSSIQNVFHSEEIREGQVPSTALCSSTEASFPALKLLFQHGCQNRKAPAGHATKKQHHKVSD